MKTIFSLLDDLKIHNKDYAQYMKESWNKKTFSNEQTSNIEKYLRDLIEAYEHGYWIDLAYTRNPVDIWGIMYELFEENNVFATEDLKDIVHEDLRDNGLNSRFINFASNLSNSQAELFRLYNDDEDGVETTYGEVLRDLLSKEYKRIHNSVEYDLNI